MSQDAPNLTAVHRDIQTEESPFSTTYTGTREHLVAAGVATADMFPPWPKRKKWSGSDLPTEVSWHTQYVKGGRYCVARGHEYRKPPPAWNPATYRAGLRRQVEIFMGILIDGAAGQIERDVYGRCVHRLADKDIAALRQLREMLLASLAKSVVKPGLRGLH